MMNTFPYILAMCGSHRPSFPYRLLREALCSGMFSFIGWLAIFAIVISCLVVIVRHFVNPLCHTHGTHFFAIAHVCFLVFLHNSIVSGLHWTHAGTVMISLAIGMCIALGSVVIVSAILKRLPKPSFWPCFGLACAAASISMLAGFILTIIYAEPINN